MDKPTYEELVDALESMVAQYLEDYSGRIDHSFMSAGEHATDCLQRLGYLEGTARAHYWTKKSFYWKNNESSN